MCSHFDSPYIILASSSTRSGRYRSGVEEVGQETRHQRKGNRKDRSHDQET